MDGAAANAAIQLQGTLTLGVGSNLFTSSSDDVVFGFGPYTAFLPAGSFTSSGLISSYSGTINGSPAQFTLTSTSGRTYSFSVAVQNAKLAGVTAPVSIDLYIGDNAGSGTALPIAQVITFGALPSSITTGSAVALSATSSSGLQVTFSTHTPSVCTVSATTVKGIAAGTCTVAANQAGNGIYAAAPTVQRSVAVVISKQPQTIEFAPIRDRPLREREFRIHARASSGLPVIVSSLTGHVCVIREEDWVQLLAVGTCRLEARQSGNPHFAPAAPVEQSFHVLRRHTQNAGS